MDWLVSRRAMMGAALLGGGGLALAPRVLAAAGDPYLRHVNPELRTAAAAVLAQPQEPLTMATLPQLRRLLGADYQPVPGTSPAWERRRVAVPPTRSEVTVYVIGADAGRSRPAVVHTHGGGMVAGSAAAAIPALQQLSRDLDAVVMTVEYSLAPEARFDRSIEENYAALAWLHDNAPAMGVDPTRIALLGESAGGGHAALLAITARDRGHVPVAFQCLVYPMLDDRTGSTRAVSPFMGRLIWTAQQNRFGWNSFLGMTPGGPGVPARAVPARTADLAGLPPAFIGVGGLDLFHDEDVHYARRLTDAAVPTELIVVPGAFHAFDGLGAAAPIVRWFNAAKLDALRRALAVPTPVSSGIADAIVPSPPAT